MSRQFYRDLGLRRSATQTEIKAAYRDLAKRYHPDKNKAPSADAKFKQVAAAHETLSDPDKRRMYDMYGDDYENVQKQRSQQQQRHRQQDFDPFGRRRPQVPPIFSVTMTLTPENYRDLVEESESSWLLQFYHDHSEPCKEFAQRWEALAHKLSPMVRLGRVRIDDNFGLVQRYRSFLRCRQSAFFLQCDAPALILATVTADGETRAEAYRGGLNAEQVYEWVKRSFTDTRRVVAAVQASEAGLQHFLRPPPRRGRAAAAGQGDLGAAAKPKALFFTSRAAADSLLARYIASHFQETISLGAVHIDGGLHANTDAARLATACGVTELPAVAVWADGARTSQPAVHLIGASPDTKQRSALIADIARTAAPSVPLLSAANLHALCAPGAWDDEGSFCVLLLLPRPWSEWDADARRAFTTLQALKTGGGSTGRVRYAWVDAIRQLPFAQFLRTAAPATQLPAAATAEQDARRPGIFALRGHEGGAGLRRVRVARYDAGPMAEVTQLTLRTWLESLQESRNWRAAKAAPPPLRAAARPAVHWRLYAWAVQGGWLLLVLLLGGFGALAWCWPDIAKAMGAADVKAGQAKQAGQQQQAQAQQQAQQQARQQAQQAQQARSRPESEPEPSPSRQQSSGGAAPSPPQEPARRPSVPDTGHLPRLSAGMPVPMPRCIHCRHPDIPTPQHPPHLPVPRQPPPSRPATAHRPLDPLPRPPPSPPHPSPPPLQRASSSSRPRRTSSSAS